MKNILKKPTSKLSDDSSSKYEFLNLSENPFPVTPFVNKVSDDNRYNGRIYESRIRETEYSNIIENFIKVSQSDPNHIRLAYINDNSYVGRGNGKSAFTLNLIDRINLDYCMDISEDLNKCFGLHVSPEPSGRTKSFYDLVDLIFEEIINKNIIKYSLASLRAEILSERMPGKINFEKENDLIEKLNDPEFFKEKQIKINEISNYIFEKAEFKKINSLFPLYKDRNVFYTYSVTTQKDFVKYYSELKKGKERINFIFNELVLFFKASGFNGSYIIIDDFERIPDFQSEKLKHEFALEVRTNLFDGISENAKVGFYNMILVLHAGVPRLIEKAWAVSGMNRRSPLINETGAVSKHIISFNKLDVNHAKSLIEIYLNQYRITDESENKLSPFNDSSIALISEISEFNASAILEKAHLLIEEAVKEKVKLIDDNFVRLKLGKDEEIGIEDHGDISKEESDSLFNKAKTK
ncbi:MAG: hypothetical protein J0L86_10805 [Flavobacteriales bacterium]|nr:hypothetical protein [Flavobacteriales bacterium]